MACDCIIGGFCSPECPERVEDPEPVAQCGICGGTIRAGEAFYPSWLGSRIDICRPCLEEANGLDVLEWMGEKLEVAGAQEDGE